MEESRLIVARLFQLAHAGRIRTLTLRIKNEDDERSCRVKWYGAGGRPYL
jgi:hypothetical protein